ncbi:MAG: hypothetical protein V1735_05385 [Nanoarchaeota archaeon]
MDAKLIKQHNLPWNELELAFDLDDAKTVRDVRKKVGEHFDSYAKYVEELVQPEATLANLTEAKQFTEAEKKRMFALYRRLMFLQRLSLEVGIDNDEKKDAQFLKESLSEWTQLKPEIKAIFSKLKEAWSGDSDAKEEAEYFG